MMMSPAAKEAFFWFSRNQGACPKGFHAAATVGGLVKRGLIIGNQPFNRKLEDDHYFLTPLGQKTAFFIPASMKADDFVRLARKILNGKASYDDAFISIRADFNGLDLQVTRKPMTFISEDLPGTNPVTMVKNGQVIRHHGEHVYITNHMDYLNNGDKLWSGLVPDDGDDAIAGSFIAPNGAIVIDGHVHACHVDSSENPKYLPDGCVLSQGLPEGCGCGTLGNGQTRKTKWTCPFWRRVDDDIVAAVVTDQLDA